MTATENKERGILAREGMGGFLCPPTHPMHNWHVQFDLRRRPENRGGMALDTAADCEYLSDETRVAARRKLESWERPALESDEVQAWVRQVLGYFAGCYLPSDRSRKVSDLVIDKNRNPMEHINSHRGVDLIREYYPEFVPTPEHFSNARWGN